MNYYLDTRSVGKDGRCPLRLRMTKGGKSTMILTGVRISPKDWKDGRAKDTRLNQRLRDMIDNAEDYVLQLKSTGAYESMTASELAADICRRVFASETKPARKDLFAGHLERFIDRQKKEGTRHVYSWTLDTLAEFDKDIRSRTFRQIDFNYLTRFESWCMEKGMKVNTISILMRNIRAVFNDALKDGATTDYPFRRFRIKSEETRKRSLTADDLRQLKDMEVSKALERFRDYFMLMFYLIGINMTDLFHARPEDLCQGRLNYRRDKTGKMYSVKVEPEAMAIIDKYRGKDWLLEPMDNHADFLDWRSQFNRRLKSIGFKDLSSYWARHTWATLAYQIGVPIDIIGQALGHSDRSHAVTFIYIKPDEAKVDEANRKVIDYIKKGPIL